MRRSLKRFYTVPLDFSRSVHQISRFCGFAELIIDIAESAMTFNARPEYPKENIANNLTANLTALVAPANLY